MVVNVEPAMLQPGDLVTIGSESAHIKAIDGPDLVGAYDLYLDNNSHKIVSEPIPVRI